jgi:hypothetical protein
MWPIGTTWTGDRSWYGPLRMVKWILSRTFYAQKNEKCEITHTQPFSCCSKLIVENEKISALVMIKQVQKCCLKETNLPVLASFAKGSRKEDL